jgi:hypothetical protein
VLFRSEVAAREHYDQGIVALQLTERAADLLVVG